MDKKVIVIQALEEERVELPEVDGYNFLHVFCGCGKVAAAIALLKAIIEERPCAVLNVGTVGSVAHRVGDIVLCDKFVDRDLNPLCIYGIVSEVNSDCNEEILKRIVSSHDDGLETCSTGDSFVTDTLEKGDVCDMESFAMALVCEREKIPFLAVKYVTDIVGQNSVASWESKLADSRKALTQYLSKI